MAGLARVLLVAASLCLAVPAGAAGPRDTSAYQGLGTWVDIWDGAQWAKPEAAVARMRDLGVTTLYLETSNYSQAVDLLRPAALGRFVDAAHANGLRIVAWYLPSFANVARDLRRSLAAVRFRSPKGEAFDSFALDIEAKVVPSAAKRSVRLLGLSRALRKAVGPDYPLGAIIPSPRGMQLNPKYWPRFPYAGLAKTYDVFMPMGYFTYRYEDAAGDAGIHGSECRDCFAPRPATRRSRFTSWAGWPAARRSRRCVLSRPQPRTRAPSARACTTTRRRAPRNGARSALPPEELMRVPSAGWGLLLSQH